MFEAKATAVDQAGNVKYYEARGWDNPPNEILQSLAAGPAQLKALKAKHDGEDDQKYTVTFSSTGNADVVVADCSYATVQEFQEHAHGEAGKALALGRAKRAKHKK